MKTYIKTLLFTLLLMSSITLKADTDTYSNPETEFSPADPNGDPGAPIDDYLWVLVFVGLAFAIVKLRTTYKQEC